MPKLKAFGAGERRLSRLSRASIERMLLRMIRQAIRFDQPCPTNAEFAFGAGLADANAASYRLRRLRAAGYIALIDHGPFERRQVLLIETGQITRRAPL